MNSLIIGNNPGKDGQRRSNAKKKNILKQQQKI